MIYLNIYNEYWMTVIGRIPDIKRVVFTRTEAELRNKIKSIENNEFFLVCVVPSSDTESPNHDSIRERETCIIYLLKKVARSNQSEADDMDNMQQCQYNIAEIKRLMLADSENHDFKYHSLIKQIDFDKMHTDPEYDFLESDGYSISFLLTTNGF